MFKILSIIISANPLFVIVIPSNCFPVFCKDTAEVSTAKLSDKSPQNDGDAQFVKY